MPVHIFLTGYESALPRKLKKGWALQKVRPVNGQVAEICRFYRAETK